jgi:DNA-binding response OmpR family regulator
MNTLISSADISFVMAVDTDSACPSAHVPTEPMRILFVDDDPILREFAVANLASEDTVIEAVGEGAAALAAIESNPPDMLVLDLELPDVDGFEVLRSLRADPAHRTLPVIVVAGREDVDGVERAFAAGATSFAVKPLNWRLLAHQLRYVHRTATNERRLFEGRAATARQLMRLAAEGAQFITQALNCEPNLKDAAVSFAKAADEALNPPAAAA